MLVRQEKAEGGDGVDNTGDQWRQREFSVDKRLVPPWKNYGSRKLHAEASHQPDNGVDHEY